MEKRFYQENKRRKVIPKTIIATSLGAVYNVDRLFICIIAK